MRKTPADDAVETPRIDAPGEGSRGSPRISRRQALRITAAFGTALLAGGAISTALLDAAGTRRRSSTRVRMATPVTITVVHDDPAAADALIEATFAEIGRLEGIFTRHRPESPLSVLARERVLRDAPSELIELLHRSREFAVQSAGAFDVTIAPVLDLYRNRFAAGESMPAAGEVEEALSLVDYRSLELEGSVVSLNRPGMAVTLDGIAKGYIVDRALALLAAAGAGQVLVDAGGDMATSSGTGWEIAVQDPRNAKGSLGMVYLQGGGIASSGDYLQAFTSDRSLHHILDPRTGRSPLHTSAVTIMAASAMEADAL
ncbi:MAG: FAD:protein FMN transferase, partial [Gemmatimonadota bacterium]|nr:FAD:protein FMN transferase [Gemmatimonadota bacterium]